MIPANVLIDRDLLCHKGKQTIIEGDQCWVPNINAIESQGISTRVETEQLKTLIDEYKKSFAKGIKELEKSNLVQMEIKLVSSVPVCTKP